MQIPDVMIRRFGQADETRHFPKGRFEIVRIGGVTIGRATYEPGWKWSEHVGPGVHAMRCTSEHVGLVIAGAASAEFDDGRVDVFEAGDLFYIPPIPHDSWVVGDQPYVSLHLLGAETYAADEGRAGDGTRGTDPHCFVCGAANAVSLGAAFAQDPHGGSTATYVARRDHEGWPGILHGGVLFALLDDAAGWAARYRGRPSVTGRAEIRYRAPVATHTPLNIAAHVRARGRVLTATAEARRSDSGDVVADLEATLFPLSARIFAQRL